MTKRDDHTKRIKELCNAAICYPFHTVCVLFSDNVSELENNLHKALDEYRFVKENKRKEFFLIDKEKLIEIVHRYDITAKLNFEE